MTELNTRLDDSENVPSKREIYPKIKHTVSYSYLNDLHHVSDGPWNYEFDQKGKDNYKDDDMYNNI